MMVQKVMFTNKLYRGDLMVYEINFSKYINERYPDYWLFNKIKADSENEAVEKLKKKIFILIMLHTVINLVSLRRWILKLSCIKDIKIKKELMKH